MDNHECEMSYWPSKSYGEAIEICYGDDGELWVSNGEYTSRVNYCPVCGYKALKQFNPTENKE